MSASARARKRQARRGTYNLLLDRARTSSRGNAGDPNGPIAAPREVSAGPSSRVRSLCQMRGCLAAAVRPRRRGEDQNVDICAALALAVGLSLAACGGGHSRSASAHHRAGASSTGLPGMPPLLDPRNVYAAGDAGKSESGGGQRSLAHLCTQQPERQRGRDRSKHLHDHPPLPGRRTARARDPLLRPRDALCRERPRQQRAGDRSDNRAPSGGRIHVPDPYNMYFTPDGRYAITVAEILKRLDFRDAHDGARQVGAASGPLHQASRLLGAASAEAL